jgi:rod shape determining protein RodA
MKDKTKFNVYMATASQYCLHTFVNIAMVIGIFPTIKVPHLFLMENVTVGSPSHYIPKKMDANKVNEW